jgi:hypothetical protein
MEIKTLSSSIKSIRELLKINHRDTKAQRKPREMTLREEVLKIPISGFFATENTEPGHREHGGLSGWLHDLPHMEVFGIY